MTATTFAQILTLADRDAILTNVLDTMTAADRDALLDTMTPRERRTITAAGARHSLRQRAARRTWSTEKVARLIATPDLTVTLIPGDHGGWTVTTTDHQLILTTDGHWTPAELVYRAPAGVALEDHLDATTKWPTPEAAVEAICTTI
ncbi:hypothetical protein ACFYOK_04660 [Microbispora bryophytorum]|uniref:hypothetical protein n=1 Tax=Microbispora bryophytorum TaxID=1460882 RepID=UPI0033CF2C4D